MDALSPKQFSHLYPYPPGGLQSEKVWYQIIKLWREDGKLKERIHWMYSKEDGHVVRVYSQLKVVKLIAHEARGDRPRPRIAYLCQEYYEQFLEILTTHANPVSNETEEVTP